MSFDYPVTLNLKNKKCSVIGGGEVALRKVQTFLDSAAAVFVVSPRLCPSLMELARCGKIRWIEDHYREQYLQDSFLVIAATNIREINGLIAAYCRENRILVNVVDSPGESSFIVNSFLKRGELLIAVSTNGKSPALAGKIIRELGELYGPGYIQVLALLGEAREMARELLKDQQDRKKFLQEIIDSEIIASVLHGNMEAAREEVRKCLSSYLA
ncbi:MAG: Siroheme synthase [Dehalococcoidia bacterium]|nr:Siroheme synthase [Bacillota bacterium]